MEACRCCLSEGYHSDIYSTHIWHDKKEVYSEMLRDCFSIILSSEHNSTSICEICIKTLRSSLMFKQQVLATETKLMQKSQELAAHVMKTEVKQEIELEDVNNDIDDGCASDDYSLADTVKSLIMKNKGLILKKVKSDTKRPKKRLGKSKVGRADAEVGEDKPLRKMITLKPEGDTKPELIKLTKKRFITIKTGTILVKKGNDKTKHKDNLITILKCSNATPFKNKTLLGYICGFCNATYPDPADLRTHNRMDHKNCNINVFRFDFSELQFKLDVTDLICTICNAEMENLSTLKDHLVSIHGKVIHRDVKDHLLQFKLKKGEVYDCALCTSTYETFKMLKQHMNKHYQNYVCSQCDTAFVTKRSLKAHLVTHEEGNFKCDHCDKVFRSKQKKQYHERTKHLGVRFISNCLYCNIPFKSYYQRNQHLIKVHNTEAQYKCNVCSKTYILKSLLMSHIKKNHLMERNYQCTECGYRFFSKKALKAHMVKHTGERNYACEVCHKTYARKYTLREHMRIHNNDRRFKCSVCGMTFVQKCSLKSHLLSNHGISMAASDITCS